MSLCCWSLALSNLQNHCQGGAARNWDRLIILDSSDMEEEVGALTSECTGWFWIWILLYCLLCKAAFLDLLNSLLFKSWFYHTTQLLTGHDIRYIEEIGGKVGWLPRDSLFLACPQKQWAFCKDRTDHWKQVNIPC